MIDGTRITELLRRAKSDFVLRSQLFHCPDVILQGGEFTEAEASSIRRGDLSIVDLDDETLQWGREVFNEIPNAGDMPPEHARTLVFALRAGDSDPCA